MNQPLVTICLCLLFLLCTTGSARGQSGETFDPVRFSGSSWNFFDSSDKHRRKNYDLRSNSQRDHRDLNDSHHSNFSPDGANSFETSEFKASSFMDTDFHKNSYREPILSDPTSETRKDSGKGLNDDMGKPGDVRDGKLAIYPGKKPADQRPDKTAKDLTKPAAEMLHDWVPGKFDPLDNGGFALGPDNGSPVPYRLNGHLDPDSKLPWQAGP